MGSRYSSQKGKRRKRGKRVLHYDKRGPHYDLRPLLIQLLFPRPRQRWQLLIGLLVLVLLVVLSIVVLLFLLDVGNIPPELAIGVLTAWLAARWVRESTQIVMEYPSTPRVLGIVRSGGFSLLHSERPPLREFQPKKASLSQILRSGGIAALRVGPREK